MKGSTLLIGVSGFMLLASPALGGSAQTHVNAHLVDGMHATDIIAAATASSSGAINEIVTAAKASTATAISSITQAAASSATPAIDAAAAAARAAAEAVEAANDAADAATVAGMAALQAAEAARAAAAGSAASTPQGIPPSWHQILPGDKRFELVLNDEAVLDKETGLVWERSPSQLVGTVSSSLYQEYCTALTVGGRMGGWRVPSVEELASLVDTSSYFAGEPSLSTGHPFDTDCSSGGCVAATTYWTTNTKNTIPNRYVVDFSVGSIKMIYDNAWDPKLLQYPKNPIWCVRRPSY